MFLAVSCLTATAAFVTVEFGGRITGGDMGFPTGARITGYFTYESGRPSGPQTSSRPNFVFEIPETQYRLERSSCNFVVYDNWMPPGENVIEDAFRVGFSYPGGWGSFDLGSRNTGLFANNVLPPAFPTLEQFDTVRTLYLIVDELQYHSTRVDIDRLWVVPGSGLDQPVIFGVERTQAGVGFRFLTEPSAGYGVEVTGDLAKLHWPTLTNLGSAMAPIAIINDAQSGLEQRFYRIRKNAIRFR